jgi:hypothetical protein
MIVLPRLGYGWPGSAFDGFGSHHRLSRAEPFINGWLSRLSAWVRLSRGFSWRYDTFALLVSRASLPLARSFHITQNSSSCSSEVFSSWGCLIYRTIDSSTEPVWLSCAISPDFTGKCTRLYIHRTSGTEGDEGKQGA